MINLIKGAFNTYYWIESIIWYLGLAKWFATPQIQVAITYGLSSLTYLAIWMCAMPLFARLKGMNSRINKVVTLVDWALLGAIAYSITGCIVCLRYDAFPEGSEERQARHAINHFLDPQHNAVSTKEMARIKEIKRRIKAKGGNSKAIDEVVNKLIEEYKLFKAYKLTEGAYDALNKVWIHWADEDPNGTLIKEYEVVRDAKAYEKADFYETEKRLVSDEKAVHKTTAKPAEKPIQSCETLAEIFAKQQPIININNGSSSATELVLYLIKAAIFMAIAVYIGLWLGLIEWDTHQVAKIVEKDGLIAPSLSAQHNQLNQSGTGAAANLAEFMASIKQSAPAAFEALHSSQEATGENTDVPATDELVDGNYAPDETAFQVQTNAAYLNALANGGRYHPHDKREWTIQADYVNLSELIHAGDHLRFGRTRIELWELPDSLIWLKITATLRQEYLKHVAILISFYLDYWYTANLRRAIMFKLCRIRSHRRYARHDFVCYRSYGFLKKQLKCMHKAIPPFDHKPEALALPAPEEPIQREEPSPNEDGDQEVKQEDEDNISLEEDGQLNAAGHGQDDDESSEYDTTDDDDDDESTEYDDTTDEEDDESSFDWSRNHQDDEHDHEVTPQPQAPANGQEATPVPPEEPQAPQDPEVTPAPPEPEQPNNDTDDDNGAGHGQDNNGDRELPAEPEQPNNVPDPEVTPAPPAQPEQPDDDTTDDDDDNGAGHGQNNNDDQEVTPAPPAQPEPEQPNNVPANGQEATPAPPEPEQPNNGNNVPGDGGEGAIGVADPNGVPGQVLVEIIEDQRNVRPTHKQYVKYLNMVFNNKGKMMAALSAAGVLYKCGNMVGLRVPNEFVHNLLSTTGEGQISSTLSGGAVLQNVTVAKKKEVHSKKCRGVRSVSAPSDKTGFTVISVVGLIAGAATTLVCPPAGVAILGATAAGQAIAATNEDIKKGLDQYPDAGDFHW